MKINYTLPGYRPETGVGNDVVELFDSPFKNRMEAFERRQPIAWRELLGLNRKASDPSQIAQPESAFGESPDATSVRQQWRALLRRHGGFDEWRSSPAPVRRMLALLESYQKESDRLFSRGLSEREL